MNKECRMADWFTLPVETENGFDEGAVADCRELDLIGRQAGAAVHAINNHDAMQDKIEAFSSELEDLQRLNNAHDGPIEMHDAIAALICKSAHNQLRQKSQEQN